ncbi:MAG: hypothetical protein BA864_13060 [Desulfuromonadales bacterium C00003093]|nr:MAG: hypothetical protein BA864_13060 [Desulfuromonadales bacterium C00003093]
MHSPTTIIPEDLEATVAEYQRLRPLMTELHTGANLSLGQTHDVAGFQSYGTQLNEKQEQTLNEEAIFRWRAIIGETEG